MPEIVIYSSRFCPFCARAKRLLTSKGVVFTEIDVDQDPAKRIEMVELADGRDTVPQIFIHDRPIGGCDELFALEHSGELDRMLER